MADTMPKANPFSRHIVLSFSIKNSYLYEFYKKTVEISSIIIQRAL